MQGIHRALLGVAVAIALCAPTPASVAEMRAPAEAMAMVKRVAEKFRTAGPQATFKLGIRHEDWRRKGFTYYGPIDDPHQVIATPEGAPSDYLNVYAIAAGRPIESPWRCQSMG